MIRLLILGGNGFLGKWIGKTFNNQSGYEVLLPERNDYDLLDQESLTTLIKNLTPDTVINLAGKSHVQDSVGELYAVNAEGQLNLLKALSSAKFSGNNFYISSSNIYGSNNENPLQETTAPKPVNHYGCSKLLGEHFCWMMSEEVQTTIIRLFSVIGPGQSDSFLIPKLVDHFVQKRPVLELGNTNVSRDFIDVRDFCNMMLTLLGSKNPPEVLNFANQTQVSLYEILQILEQRTNHSPEIKINPQYVRKNEIRSQCGDNNLLRGLGYVQEHTIAQTIDMILNQYRSAIDNP